MTPLDIEARIAALETDTHTLRIENDRLKRRNFAQSAILCVIAPLCFVLSTLTPAGAQIGVTLSSLAARMTVVEAANATQNTQLANLETKTASMSTLTDPNTNQSTVRFSNVNVQIVDGSGDTSGTTNGRGNLIVGYNETRSTGNDRTGSHNVIVGSFNNYTSAAYGGLAMGSQNTISGNFASVTAGAANTASGFGSNVSGGNGNIASGLSSTVSGGALNTANGQYSSVAGGTGNRASNLYDSVAGGNNNTASGGASSVAGGNGNTASGNYQRIP